MEYSKVWPSCAEWFRLCCFINVINGADRRGRRCLIHFQSVSFDRPSTTLLDRLSIFGGRIFFFIFSCQQKETCVKSPEMLGQSALSSLSRGGRSDTKNMKTGKSYQVDHSKEGQCGACLIGNRRGMADRVSNFGTCYLELLPFLAQENIERMKLRARTICVLSALQQSVQNRPSAVQYIKCGVE